MDRYVWAVLLALLVLPLTARAETTADARQFVDMVGKKALETINSDASHEEKQQQLRQMFSQYVDMGWMGRFVLGRAWQQASPEERNTYLEAYRQYMLNRYTDNFADYAGSQYTITGARDEGNNEFIVSMDVNAPQASDQQTQAGYRLRLENGQFRIIDIIIEGVSQLTTQRSEFASVVQRNGMEGLIKQLQAKARQPAKT